MTPQQVRDTANRLYNESKYAEAIPFLKSAAEALPKEEALWQQLAFACTKTNQHQQAVDYLKQAIRHHPGSGWLWRLLGHQLTATDSLTAAEKALSHAETILGTNDIWLCRYYVSFYLKQKNIPKQIEALERLFALGAANAVDLNDLGIAYFHQKNFGKSIEYYRLSIQKNPTATALHNLGLVYSENEISQDVDAADAFLQALTIEPKCQPAELRVQKLALKLIPLSKKAKETITPLLRPEEAYQHYLNPFEVLQIEPGDGDKELDIKIIQRAKKRLLQEIDLNDGKVSWLNDFHLDKSKAIIIDEDLLQPHKRLFHSQIFKNTQLLRFLTLGELDHFFYRNDPVIIETLTFLDREPDFRRFISKPFAHQYNTILTRAIDRRLLPIVEVLFDGRRWVTPEDDDLCFDGAYKRINVIVEQMKALSSEGETTKISTQKIQEFLSENSLPEIFNLLPVQFASAQREITAHLRSLAISAFNIHDDSRLSKIILSFCKGFTTRSVELAKKLEEDFKTIDRMIAEEKKIADEEIKNSFSGFVRTNGFLSIKNKVLTYCGESISADAVESVRWGVSIERVNGSVSRHDFTIVIGSKINTIEIEWGKPGLLAGAKGFFRKPFEEIPINEQPSDKQGEYFQRMLNAIIYHLIPSLIGKLFERLNADQPVTIGPCVLTKTGATFTTGLMFGLIFKKEHHIPWNDIGTHLENGEVYLFSNSNRKIITSMTARTTNNAVILPFICTAMKKA
jgi:tetratricopeptide (TPR) repeat protein